MEKKVLLFSNFFEGIFTVFISNLRGEKSLEWFGALTTTQLSYNSQSNNPTRKKSITKEKAYRTVFKV